jgi:plastocyanin
MRMSLVRAAACFGLVILSAGGCEVGDGTTPGGSNDGDNSDDVGDSGDAGDDSTTDDALPPDAPDPSLRAVIDRPSLATELGSENMVTITIQGENGFSGPVTISPRITDAAGAPVTSNWNVLLDQSTVTLPANGTSTVVATMAIPSERSLLTAKVNFDITSSDLSISTVSAVVVTDQVTLRVGLGGGGCEYPANSDNVRVKVGTKVRFLNSGTAGLMRIHTSGGDGIGMPHQDNDMGPNEAYEVTGTDAGTASWYCHSPGPTVGGLNVQVVN